MPRLWRPKTQLWVIQALDDSVLGLTLDSNHATSVASVASATYTLSFSNNFLSRIDVSVVLELSSRS